MLGPSFAREGSSPQGTHPAACGRAGRRGTADPDCWDTGRNQHSWTWGGGCPAPAGGAENKGGLSRCAGRWGGRWRGGNRRSRTGQWKQRQRLRALGRGLTCGASEEQSWSAGALSRWRPSGAALSPVWRARGAPCTHPSGATLRVLPGPAGRLPSS